MKFRALHVAGFGRLAERRFTFGNGLTIVAGPNEAGKSTLAAALVASLYGLGRGQKERWRPWHGAPYATTLQYALDDGRGYEVRREFERDRAGVRITDEHGRDVAAEVADGRALAPGDIHLGLPLEAYVNAACVRQRLVAIEEGKAGEAVAGALARALDGGPREDAALGALARLEAARKAYVGTAKATKKHPLKTARKELEAVEARLTLARAERDALAETRERLAVERAARDRTVRLRDELGARVRAGRATHLASRLERVRTVRDEIARVQGELAGYDDVARFDADRVGELEDAYRTWSVSAAHAESARREADAACLGVDDRAELAARRADVGTLDEVAYAALAAAVERASAARATADAARAAVAMERREGDGGRRAGGALILVSALALAVAVGFAVAHWWAPVVVAAAVALVAGGFAIARAGARAGRLRGAAERQRRADGAVAEEAAAASAVAAVLEPLRVASFDELARRRTRFEELRERDRAAQEVAARAEAAERTSLAEFRRLDELARALVPGGDGDARDRLIVARARAARRREHDGLLPRLHFLEMQRDDALAGDDLVAIERELAALAAEGVQPGVDDVPLRALERERDETDQHAREADRRCAELEGELRAGEVRVPDLAVLEDAVVDARAEVTRLETFERALNLAVATIERRKDEAHKAFARRLADYTASTLGRVTGGRYGEVFIDPGTLEPRVRVPETGAIEALDALSAGARDQVYLVVRFAMARMFAEGGETPPLLLDDPFAFWDDDRIARCLPVLLTGTFAAQAVVFTTSRTLADAAEAAGAQRIDLDAPALAAV